jgi:hypothetical protein
MRWELGSTVIVETFSRSNVSMSALPPKADIGCGCWDVRFVPGTDIELRHEPRPLPAPVSKISSLAFYNLQSLDSAETRSRAPANARLFCRERQPRPTLQQGLQRAPAFNTRELVA